MSNFLVEDTAKSFKERVLDILGVALADPLNPILDPLKSAIPGYLEVNPPTLPITQITGFTQFTPNSSAEAASGTTNSTAYTATLSGATDGVPSFSDLPDGQYVLVFGAVIADAGGGGAYMSPAVNSTSATDANGVFAETTTTVKIPGSRMITATLNNKGSNTITSNYRSVGGGTVSFRNRWMVAIKYANT